VAKSPYGAELTFVHLCGVLPLLQGSLRGSFAGSILARFDPAKDSAKQGELLRVEYHFFSIKSQLMI